MNDQHVFINVPFDISYEPLLLALVSGLVTLGLTPRCVVEIPESGRGRIARLQDLIGECGTSIHDLSKVNLPVRFNMPFELGLATALQKSSKDHAIVVLERKPYRLQRTLSDYNGRDPIIHNGSRERLLLGVLDAFETESPPSPETARRVLRLLFATKDQIKQRFRAATFYSRNAFLQLVETAVVLALEEGAIEES